MVRALRDPEEVAGWLSTGLCLMRMSRPCSASLDRAVPWLRASISDAPALPPVGIIADVGTLLEGGKLDLDDAMPVADGALTTRQTRAAAEELLPGVRVKRLLFFRYLLVWQKPA